MSTRYRIALEGVVQGVGFRPFVKRLADRLCLPGVVFNTGSGLIIEIQTPSPADVATFVSALQSEAPVAAKIERCVIEELGEMDGYRAFTIVSSVPHGGSFTLLSPDLAACAACLDEIRNPADRRFHYAFTNCTNCGPRYSITLAVPYDRPNTTMKGFPMCADCAAEYANPADRRFHAEPIACPACGPQLSANLSHLLAALESGRIVAIKGLGGFQLACDAFRGETVDRLRDRKRRSRKPFAVMMRDLATIERYCVLDPCERSALASPAAPILLLKMRDPHAFPPGVAPGLREIGVMLPYTPLHHLLFAGALACLVMTSGNTAEEPIVTQNAEAAETFPDLADEIVTHNRDIFMRVDDSVARVFEDVPRVLRRARGYAPAAVSLRSEFAEVLAVGAELKNTFCLTRGAYAILSQHIGDLENFETLQFFEETLRNLKSVYRAQPRAIAHDLHPDYLSTRWALARPEPKIAVQHHHAHIASCMAENGVRGRVIGVAFDGTGFGADGQIWGGEFLVCGYDAFERIAHLRYVPLPGGDRAARETYRMAAAYLSPALGPDFRRLDLPCWNAAPDSAWKILEQLIRKPTLTTSSCGRLFDAVSAICGISQNSSYEGEAAMLLEAAADLDGAGEYTIPLLTQTLPWIIDTPSMVAQIARDVAAGRPIGAVAGCFHDSMAHMIESVCAKVRDRSGLNKVCLSGGTFQNFTLLRRAVCQLRRSGFEVFLHSQVPPNDGGISLGQAAIAAALLEQEGS